MTVACRWGGGGWGPKVWHTFNICEAETATQLPTLSLAVLSNNKICIHVCISYRFSQQKSVADSKKEKKHACDFNACQVKDSSVVGLEMLYTGSHLQWS